MQLTKEIVLVTYVERRSSPHINIDSQRLLQGRKPRKRSRLDYVRDKVYPDFLVTGFSYFMRLPDRNVKL